MAKVKKINENYNLSYSSREADTSDTIMDCNISFENPADDSVLIHRLNTWLIAIGRPDVVVAPRELPKGAK